MVSTWQGEINLLFLLFERENLLGSDENIFTTKVSRSTVVCHFNTLIVGMGVIPNTAFFTWCLVIHLFSLTLLRVC